jgi:hydroxymethylglutaryl-CoA synthase
MVSIAGYGAYVPLYRIERSTIAEQHGAYPSDGELSVPSHDEDHITLGVSAAKEALAHADVNGEALDAVYVASVSDPFDEHGLAPHVAYAVGADGDVRVADLEGSARAATTAVQTACDAVETGAVDTALVVATDILSASPGSSVERTAGAGAGALVLSRDGDVADVSRTTTETTGFVGRFTVDGRDAVEGDTTFNREEGYLNAVPCAVGRLTDGEAPVDADHAALPAPEDGWGDRALGMLDLGAERHGTFASIGYAGAASVLLDGIAAIEAADPGDRLLLASYGPGGSDALLLEAGDGAAGAPETTLREYLDSKEYVTYAKHREYRETAGGGA